MGRPKKNEEKPKAEPNDKALQKALDDLDDINPDASTLSESSLSFVNDWIDTGCYALNAIISGSVFKGIPSGRVSGLYGLQQTGKTLIMNKILANAQAKGYRAVYFDSENALDIATAERLGCDASKIKHAPIETVEDCKHQIVTLLNKLIEANLKRKLIIFIDSIGNLVTRKELDDAAEGSGASDMGSKAKHISSLIRTITGRAARAEVPVIFSNHIYMNPAEQHPTLIKQQAGGLRPLYIASLLVQLSTTNEKIDDKNTSEKSDMSTKVSGINLRAVTAKNRFVIPFLETTLYLNFKTGLSKYVGLFDMALACKVIQQSGSTYSIGDQIIGARAKVEDNAEFWESKWGDKTPLQLLDDALQKELKYSNVGDTIESLEIEAEEIADGNQPKT